LRRTVAILFTAGLLFFFAATEADLAPAAIFATVLVAAGLSLAHPSSLADVIARRRAPSIGDAGSAVVFLIAAFLLLGALDVLLKGPAYGGRSGRLAAWIEWAYSISWLCAAVAPLLAQLRFARPASLGPAIAGLAGGMLMAAGLFYIWIAFGQTAMTSTFHDDANIVFSTVNLPLGGLFAGLGLGLWRAAFRDGSWRFSENRDAIQDSFLLAGAGLAVGGLACVYTGMTEVFALHPDLGTIAAATLCALIACGWISVFIRLRRQEPVAFWRGLAAIGLLVFAIPASLVLAGAMTQTRDWSEFTVVFLGPVAIAVAVGVLAASFFAARAVLGGAAPNIHAA
jgi:hypothetical protein